MGRPRQVLKNHPAEPAAPAVMGALTALLAAFGVDPVKAAAIAGAIAVLVPMAITWWKNR